MGIITLKTLKTFEVEKVFKQNSLPTRPELLPYNFYELFSLLELHILYFLKIQSGLLQDKIKRTNLSHYKLA